MWTKHVMVACLSIAYLCPALSSRGAEPPTSGASPFKASHVAIWCDTDAEDGCPNCEADVVIQDMNIVTGADVPHWKEFVDRQHAAGKLVWAALRPLTHMGRMLEFVLNDPDLQQAACLDLNLKPIPVGWMVKGPYHKTVPPFNCSNHPNYRAWLEQQMEFFVQADVDGVMVDDGGGSPFAYRHGGCFCEYCIRGFRKYLRDRYSDKQLREKGVDDPKSFDYRRYTLQRFGDLDSYKKQLRQGNGGPMSGDFRRFLRESDVELFRGLQAYSSKLRGRHMPMGWDNVDCREHYSPYYPFWDVFYSEIAYQNFHVDGRGPTDVFPHGIIYLNKLCDALVVCPL